MRIRTKLAVLAGALSLTAVPALAGAHHVNGPHSPPGPKNGLPAKAKAYGFLCQNQSKKHVKGEKGTPFSQCVTAMARIANGNTENSRRACKGLSKKRDDRKGTPFSRCVKAATTLLNRQNG